MRPGPSEERRLGGRCRILGEAWNAAGARVASLMETPDPYALTMQSALDLGQRVATGEVSAGYHTPSTAFGPDLVLAFDGVRRSDI